MVGTILTGGGLLASRNNFNLVHKVLKEGEKIDPHRHEGEEVFVIPAKGRLKVHLNEEEEYVAEPGVVLNFDGTHSIDVEALEDSEFFVGLLKS